MLPIQAAVTSRGHPARIPVADVAFDLVEPGMALHRGEHVLAVEVKIEHLDRKARIEQLGHEHRAYVPGASGDEHPADRSHPVIIDRRRRRSSPIRQGT